MEFDRLKRENRELEWQKNEEERRNDDKAKNKKGIYSMKTHGQKKKKEIGWIIHDRIKGEKNHSRSKIARKVSNFHCDDRFASWSDEK